MPIVQSFGALQAMSDRGPTGSPSNALRLYDYNHAYARIYATQPNVRICVDFLARNIAQLAPQVFRRISDTDRERLVDHDLARWLGKPNPSTRQYRLVENLVGDLGVYFNAGWLKVRYQDETTRRPATGLVRIPGDQLRAEGGLLKSHYIWKDTIGQERPYALSEIVYFDGYNPTNPLMGLSPLETLRRILAEEQAAGDYRETFWRNSSKHEGVWELAKDAPGWKNEPEAQSWREQWQQFASTAKAGMTAVGPKGGTYRTTSFSAKDSEYTVGGKLRREVVAAAYHIPLPLVGILEHATFSNIKEQHKHLYQDCLGPWLEMIQQEIEGQLLVDCEDQADVYVEFNIAAKLAGSFEEQASALQMAVGKPWMKPNEARAKQNLPRDENQTSDEIAPQQGGPSDATAQPSSPAPPTRTGRPSPPAPADATDDTTAAAIAPILHAARLRQQSRLARVDVVERAATFYDQIGRWTQELAADLTPILGAEAATARARAANDATLHELLALEAA